MCMVYAQAARLIPPEDMKLDHEIHDYILEGACLQSTEEGSEVALGEVQAVSRTVVENLASTQKEENEVLVNRESEPVGTGVKKCWVYNFRVCLYTYVN